MGEHKHPKKRSFPKSPAWVGPVAFFALIFGLVWLQNEVQPETVVRRSLTCVEGDDTCADRAWEVALSACAHARDVAPKDEDGGTPTWDHYQVRVKSRYVRAAGVSESYRSVLKSYYCEDFVE